MMAEIPVCCWMLVFRIGIPTGRISGRRWLHARMMGVERRGRRWPCLAVQDTQFTIHGIVSFMCCDSIEGLRAEISQHSIDRRDLQSVHRRFFSSFLHDIRWGYSLDCRCFLPGDDRVSPRRRWTVSRVCTRQCVGPRRMLRHEVSSLRWRAAWWNLFRSNGPVSSRHIHWTLANIDWCHKDACHCGRARRYVFGCYRVGVDHWQRDRQVDWRLNGLENPLQYIYDLFSSLHIHASKIKSIRRRRKEQ